jgi:murein DD-endopeptidase MepM/ murein hydrolase activator NlpD
MPRSSPARLRAALLLALAAVPLLVIAAVLGAPLLRSSLAPPATPAASSPPPGIGDPIAQPSPTPTPAGSPPSASPTPLPTPTATIVPVEPQSEPPEKLTGYVWPLRGARLTSPFGPRDDGNVMIDGQRNHDGFDLATWCGDKVRAAHSGTVLYAGRKFDEFVGYSDSLSAFYARLDGIGGLKILPIVVVIDDGNGYRSLYAHLSRANVEAGDVVAANDVIGLEGATGRATGCHLHYALIRMDGAWLSVWPDYVTRLSYPPFVRERVDPLLVMPLTHADAPLKVRRANTIPAERLYYFLERY